MKRLQRAILTRNLSALIFALASILVIGVVGAGWLTSDSRWLNWSFSRLGEEGTVSARVFNLSVALAAVILARIGWVLSENLRIARELAAARLSLICMWALSICTLGVALFPNDTMHPQHFIVSRLLVVIFSIYTIWLPLSLTKLTRREYITSFAVPFLVLGLSLQGYFLKDISFVLFEILVAAVVFSWMYVFCTHAERRKNEVEQEIFEGLTAQKQFAAKDL